MSLLVAYFMHNACYYAIPASVHIKIFECIRGRVFRGGAHRTAAKQRQLQAGKLNRDGRNAFLS